MIAVFIEPTAKVNVVEDSADDRVLEAAIYVKADVIVTGDKKHLLPLKEFKGTKIVSARTLLDFLYPPNCSPSIFDKYSCSDLESIKT